MPLLKLSSSSERMLPFSEDALAGAPVASGVEPASIVTDSATGRQYLVIPVPPPGGPFAASATEDVAHHFAAATSRVRRQVHDLRLLESERDKLADQIGQDFEELHWLRMLATVVSASQPTDGIQMVANRVLTDLAQLIRAESAVFVPETDVDTTTGADRLSVWEQTVTAGEPIGRDELERLVDEVRCQSPDGPLVFNRDSPLRSISLHTSVRNVVSIPVIQNQTRYGWLIAVNRLRRCGPRDQPASQPIHAEFGTSEVGLLTTAASMLGGHARNVELFRAEEGLRLSVIETITEALDARDPNTCGHSRRVGRYAVAIAERCGYSPEQCDRLYVTGLLHDVGKIGIPDDILKKSDRLTDEEFEVIKQHPAIGHSILTPLKGLAFVLPGVLHHHERIDGRGYPLGLAGDAIPLDARILAVADSFDAMTASRTYRDGMSPSEAIEILRAGARGQWDADVVNTFVASRAWNAAAESIDSDTTIAAVSRRSLMNLQERVRQCTDAAASES